MLSLDLKLTLFVGLLILIFLANLFWWNRKPRFSKLAKPPIFGKELWDILPFGIMVLRPDNAIVFSNQAAQRLLEEISTASDITSQQTLESFNNLSQPQLPQRSGTLHQPLFLHWWLYSLEDANLLLVLAEGADQQRFVRQQAFITQLVHELRSPLTALVAHAEILSDAEVDEAVRSSSTRTVQKEAQRMADLVRDMLELYRLEISEDLPLKPVDLLLVAEDAIAQLILVAESKKISLDFEASNPLPLVLGHPDRLKQVFLNLIDNAIKYCRPGDKVQISLQKQSDHVLCTIHDSGPGIPAGDLPHITERFYRVRTDVEGYGVGLALVSEILRRHNATLSVESTTEGQTGTTFSWQLPSIG